MRFAVLGPLSIASDPDVFVERPSHRRLLAILLLADGRPLDIDRLIDHFWDGEPPLTAKAALQTHISELRKRLGADVIRTAASRYVLPVDGHELDVHEFTAAADAVQTAGDAGRWEEAVEHAERALALWRGTPFPELQDDEFARPEIVRLEELRLEVIERRAAALLELDRTQAALADLERLALEHPLRERLWELLMIARARVGRTADALQAYRDLRHILAEMGLEPGPRLRELEERILREDPALLASGVRHNLPTHLTTFVGRDAELAELATLLDEHRLVTLTGVGGSGKTRLAQELAGRGVDRFPDGVWMVDLAPLSQPELVASAVAVAFGLRSDDRSAIDALRGALRHRSVLCLLDNCEHVLEAAAEVAGVMLAAGPGVTVLATSREALGMPGEVVFDVPPLAAPPPGPDEAGEVADYEAVRLFADRARLASRRFEVTPENAASAADICRRLDGLPLAIELAAARMGALPTQLVAERLARGLDLLAARQRGVVARHESLEATIAWSYDLLSASEQALFLRLSVFSGGFLPGAVEAVCSGDPVEPREVLTLLSALVDKSLVARLRTPVWNWARYRMLDTLQQFARDRLERSGTAGEFRRRHRDWFAALANAAEEHFETFEEQEWLDRLEAEHDNLEAALDTARETDASRPTAALASALAWYWYKRGQYRQAIERLHLALERLREPSSALAEAELRRRLAAALFNADEEDAAVAEAARARDLVADAGASPAKVRVLVAFARLLLLHIGRDPTEAVPVARQAVAAAVAADDRLTHTRALVVLGSALGWTGKVQEGIEHLRNARAIAHDLEDLGTLVVVDLNLILLLYLDGASRQEEPPKLVEEVVPLLEQGDVSWVDEWVPWDWVVFVFLHTGEWDRAQQVIDAMAARYLEGWDRVSFHMVLGSLRWMQGRLDDAAAQVERLRETGVLQRWYHDFFPLAAEIAAARGRLDEVRAFAAEHLVVETDPSEESMKLGTLRPLVAAEADAALASDAGLREEHTKRAGEALDTMRDLLDRFPPATDGSLQIETAETYLLLAEAEFTRVTGSDPELWAKARDRACYAYWKLYARWRMAEASLTVGGDKEGAAELRAVYRQASALGAQLVADRVAARLDA